MQIEGGTAAVRVFCFDENDAVTQFQVEFSNCRVDILVARIFLETIQFGCHVGSPVWKRKNCFLNTFAKTFLTKNNQLFSWSFPT